MAYLTAMAAKWSCVAPGPFDISYLDEVQQNLTAGQTFSGACSHLGEACVAFSVYEAP